MNYESPYYPDKKSFHDKWKRILRKAAKAMGYTEFQVRSNPGGFGVMGEVTLHTPNLYVQACGDCNWDGMEILYRSCCGMKDYHGGQNNWMEFSALENDLPGAIERFRAVAGG